MWRDSACGRDHSSAVLIQRTEVDERSATNNRIAIANARIDLDPIEHSHVTSTTCTQCCFILSQADNLWKLLAWWTLLGGSVAGGGKAVGRLPPPATPLAALQRSGFQEAEISRPVEDDVVEQVDADNGSGCFELCSDVDVALGWLQAAAWMIMSDDDGGGTV